MMLLTGMISRYCNQCGNTTRWQPSEEPPTESNIPRVAKPTSSGEEQRKNRRLDLAMRVPIRDMRHETEMVQTVDASKSGLCVASKKVYQIGEEIHITLPFAEGQLPSEKKGKIVWRREGSNGRLYGIKYVK